MNAEKIQDLESAIDNTTCAFGAWSVYVGDEYEYVQLVWTCDAASAPADIYGDEPWSEWGGNAIMAAAGCPDFDNSGCDIIDRHGRRMVSQWVQWRI